jgi:hypothetical protein
MPPRLELLEDRTLPSISFDVPPNIPAGDRPVAVAVGDFNHDGIPDLAVACNGSTYPATDPGGVLILLGRGDGSFAGPLAFPAGSQPASIAVGDFNGDGNLDLAVAGTALNVLFGNGDGTFKAPVTLNNEGNAVAVGDFNGDGKLDLAETIPHHAFIGSASGSVLILLGNGDGSFRAAANPVLLDAGPQAVTAADLNGDGRADLVVPCVGGFFVPQRGAFAFPGSVDILLGNGDGTFQAAMNDGGLQFAAAAAVADFNGDGKPDLAVATTAGNFGTQPGGVLVLPGRGDGTFGPAVSYDSALGFSAVVAADLNGDSKPDLAALTQGGTLVTLLNNGDGTFRDAGGYVPGLGASGLAPGDFNGDGRTDLAVADTNANAVAVLLGNGDGTLAAPPVYASTVPYQAVAVGDFNHDGKPDLAVVHEGTVTDPGAVSIFLGNGDGTFQGPLNFAAGDHPISVAVGDFNGDGIPDLAVAANGSFGDDTDPGGVVVLLGRGDGTFIGPLAFAAGTHPSAVAVGDFNGDHKLDIAVASAGSQFSGGAQGGLSVLIGTGTGTFVGPFSVLAGGSPASLAVADFNQDGKADIAVADQFGGGLTVLLGNGDGTFQPPAVSEAGVAHSPLAVGDFNGDGKPDLIVVLGGANQLGVLLGNGDGTFRAPLNFLAPLNETVTSLAVADFDGDGKQDLAVNIGSGVLVFRGNGNGTFGQMLTLPAPLTQFPSGALAVGDFNGDGKPDLAEADAGVAVLLNVSPPPEFVTGVDAGGLPEVHVYDARTGALLRSFMAYDVRFTGGVRVALGDVNGDGTPDVITAPGPGGGPDVRVFDGRTGALIREFLAYSPGFLSGVYVAAGDVNGDGYADIITGADAGGGPHVKAFSGRDGTVLYSFLAYDPAFTGGVRVAAGDVDGDGLADIVTAPGPGGGPDVRVFSGASGQMIRQYLAYDIRFTGGVYVAAGDVNGDGFADVITGAGFGGGPEVKVFSGLGGAVLQDFFAYAAAFRGGVRVAAVSDLDGDAGAEIVTAAGPSGGPQLQVFDGQTAALLDSFFAYDPRFLGGVLVGGQ